MMNNTNKKISVYTALTWIFTVLALLFRLLSRLLSYDAEIGYFTKGAIFPTLQNICLGALFLLAVAALFAFRKVSLPASVYNGMRESCVAEKISASVSALILLGVSVATVLFFRNSTTLSFSLYTGLGIAAGVVSILFFLLFCAPSKRGKVLHLFCGFFLVLYLLFVLTLSYFELYTAMNNPVKILFQLSAISSLLYLLADLHLLLGAERPARFLATSTMMIGFSSVAVISMPFFSVPSAEYTLLYRILTAVFLSLLVYGTVRVSRFLALCARADEAPLDNEENPSADGLSEEIEAPATSPTTDDGDTAETSESQETKE